MDDARPTSPPPAPQRAELEARLAEIERRLGRVDDRRLAPDDRLAELEAEIGVLRETVSDLAAGNLDLHNQLARLTSACERVLAGAGADLRRTGRLAGSPLLVVRAARRALRGAAAAARRLTGSPPAATDAVLGLELGPAEAPAERAPRVVLVLRTSDDPAAFELPAALAGQSDPGLVVAVWNEAAGRAVVHARGADLEPVAAVDRAALTAATAAELVADLTTPLPRLHPTVVERCRWAAASEGLPLRVVEGVGPGWRRGWELLPATVWTAGQDGSRLRLVKLVGGPGWGAPEGAGEPVVGAGAGRGYLPAPDHAGALVHRFAPLDGVVSAPSAGDERPVVLIVSAAAGAEVAAWLVRSLAADHRCTVVLTAADDGSAAVRGLTELAWRCYPVGGFLEPAVWPSLVADLARAHGARAVLRVGDAPGPPVGAEGRPPVVAMPLRPADIGDGADVVLAVGGDIGEAARGGGLETLDLVPGPLPAGAPPSARERDGVRSAYGVPEGARLVLAVGPLEPVRRPEDVAAVARRLAHRKDVHVLLVGRGSLTGPVSDLAGYLELDNFTLAPPGHALADLVGSCDCLLGTAEEDPWPVAIATAIALGRPVVATDVDGVREVVAAAGSPRCVLCRPGDLEAMAAALLEALDGGPPPRATKKTWGAAAARGEAAAATLRQALDRAVGGADEDR
jgi:glycosyltransferase involved in cell wall biosynthesis